MITREQLVQTENQTYRFRLLALLAIMVLVLLLKPGSPRVLWWPPVAVALGYLVYTIALHYCIVQRLFRPYIVFAVMAADWALAGSALYVFGVDSAAFLIFPMLVAYHAIYLGYAGSIISAAVSSFISLGLALQWWNPEALSVVAFRIPLLFIVATFSGYLAQRRFEERDARLALQEALRAEHQAKELVSVARGMHLDPGKMLADIAEAAAAASGASQCFVFVADRENKALVKKAVFPPLTDNETISIEAVTLPLADISPGDHSRILSGSSLPLWARGLSASRLIEVPLSSAGNCLGALYLVPDQQQPGQDLETIGDVIGSMAAAALGDFEHYHKANRQAQELLEGLQGSVQRMGRARQTLGQHTIVRNGLELNPSRQQATLGGQQVPLSPTEFDVLYYLAQHSGQTVNQIALLKAVWGEQAESRSNVVDVCIHRLRRKLSRYPEGGRLISTARGAGYILRVD